MNNKIIVNPFIVGPPVSGPNFFNRNEEITEIFQHIDKGECCSIIGNRRIGKTSLLKHIMLDTTIKSNYHVDINRQQIKMYYFDLSIYENENDFWKDLCNEIVRNEQSELPYLNLSDNYFNQLCHYTKLLNNNKIKLVLLLDEFEGAFDFGSLFFNRLRSIHVANGIVLITTSLLSFEYYINDGKLNSSPFFNIFNKIYLKLFSIKNSINFINNKFKKNKLKKFFIENILIITGQHPYFIQKGCSILLDLNINTLNNYNLIIQHFIEKFQKECEEHFDYYYYKLKIEELNILNLLSKNENYTFNSEIMTLLEQKSLIKKNAQNVFEPFSEAFRTYIKLKDLESSKEEKNITPLILTPKKSIWSRRSFWATMIPIFVVIISGILNPECIKLFLPFIKNEEKISPEKIKTCFHVKDKNNKSGVKNCEINLHIKDRILTEFTDDSGFAIFELESSENLARIFFKADSFKLKDMNLQITNSSLPQIIFLERIPLK